ncbi:MAG: hypothetical protein CMB80_31075 [Flammeovirgaceae bacterium]|nr:hypothetical protein [Flammeovirgaceae bacterium]
MGVYGAKVEMHNTQAQGIILVDNTPNTHYLKDYVRYHPVSTHINVKVAKAHALEILKRELTQEVGFPI